MPPITLAVVPSVTSGNSRVALEELCARLSGMLDTRIVGVHPESYDALTTELERDRVQFAWMPPMLLTLADEHFRIRPLLSAVRGDRTDYRAVLFTAAESPIRSLDQLRGKRVAWVDATSASGYFYPRLQLAAHGFDPAGMFSEELFLRSHGEVVRAVFDGRADVGATYAERPASGEPIRRAGFLSAAPERAARVLTWTRAIPSDVIAGHGLLPKPVRAAFSRAILELVEQPEGRKLLLRAFDAEQFVPTPRTALRQLEELVALARTYGLLPHL
jgi:phosphonate transport system substrate-binding protein